MPQNQKILHTKSDKQRKILHTPKILHTVDRLEQLLFVRILHTICKKNPGFLLNSSSSGDFYGSRTDKFCSFMIQTNQNLSVWDPKTSPELELFTRKPVISHFYVRMFYEFERGIFG